MLDHSLGEIRGGYGAPILSDEPEVVFAVVKDPRADSPEDRFITTSNALLAGQAVRAYFEGKLAIEEVLVPDPQDSSAFEIGEGTDLLLEMAEKPGHFHIIRGPVRVEEHLLALE